MDNVSPSHTGFQIFDNQGSFVSGALKGSAGGISGMIATGLGEVASDQTNHAIEESRPPTEEEYKIMEDRIRNAFKAVYGTDAYENIDEKERKATEQRNKGKSTSLL